MFWVLQIFLTIEISPVIFVYDWSKRHYVSDLNISDLSLSGSIQ